jgi:hypothetical protein
MDLCSSSVTPCLSATPLTSSKNASNRASSTLCDWKWSRTCNAYVFIAECNLTPEVSGRCHVVHEDTVPIRSGPLDRIVSTHYATTTVSQNISFNVVSSLGTHAKAFQGR